MKKNLFLILSLFSISWMVAQSPGGVSANLSLWLRPDAGTNTTINGATLTSWANQAPGGVASASGSATYIANNINFNPGVQFNGSNQAFIFSSGNSFGMSGNNSFDLFTLQRKFSAAESMYLSGNASNHIQFTIKGQRNMLNRLNVTDPIIQGNIFSPMVPKIMDFRRSGSLNQFYMDGISDGAAVNSSVSFVGGNIAIGYWYAYNNGYYDGNINEVIVYGNGGLPNIEDRNKVDTYLAVKYGITMGNTSSTVNYTSSTGVQIWTGDTTYQNNIAGIGRDDMGGAANTGLIQKQSRSVNSGIQPVIGNGNAIMSTNTRNATTMANGSFLVWGSDTGRTSFATPFAFAGLNSRMTRVWKVQETGSISSVRVALRSADLPGNLVTPHLLISSGNAIFDGGDTRIPMTLGSLDGVSYWYADVDLNNGHFFTFAGFATAPGGVITDLGAWWKADFSASGSAWADASGNGRDAGLSAGTITYNASGGRAANFNPQLTTGNGYMSYSSPVYPGTANYDNMNVFAAIQPLSGQNCIPWGERSNNVGVNSAALFHFSDNSTYFDAPFGYRATSGFAANGGNYGVSNILEGWKSGTSMRIHLQSRQIASITTAGGNYFSNTNNGNHLFAYPGQVTSGGSGISEVFAYNTPLSTTDRARVNSYLAVKYGVTLDQTTPQNYISSSGATIWDAVNGNLGFNNNIAGIGRDEASALYQKQAGSVNPGIQPVIGNGNSIMSSNASNNSTFANDLNFLVWGSNTESTSFSTPFAFSGLNNRMARIWKVQETGTVGSVRVALRSADLPSNVTYPYLLISTGNATFDGNDTRIQMTQADLDGVSYWYADVDLANGQFFTFAGVVTAPGGVTGPILWVKADAGTGTAIDGATVSQWDNQAINTNHPTQGTSRNQPLYRNNVSANINFNPVLSFNGNSSFFNIPVSLIPTGGNYGFAYFGVSSYASGAGPVFAVDNGNAANDPQNPLIGSNIVHWHSCASDVGSNCFQTNVLPLFGVNATEVYRAPGSGSIFAANNRISAVGSTLSAFSGNTLAIYMGFRNFAGGQFFGGRIPEVILYSSDLNSTKRLQVNSYLAIKYGVTLGNPANVLNYLSSDGSSIWTGDAAYQNNIFGIARDNTSALHQRISRSVNTGSVLTISTDTNFTNENRTHAPIGKDMQALVLGETTGAYAFTGTAISASGVTFGTTEIMAKRWKAQDTGGLECVNLRFDATSLAALSGNEKYYMLISDTSDFTSGVTFKEVTRVGNSIEVSVNFRDNNVSYFTLAKKDLGLSAGDLTDAKLGISTIPEVSWKPSQPNTYLEINSNAKGLVISRIANTAAILNPIEGMIIYDLSDNTMKVYTGTIWRKLGEYSTEPSISRFCN